VKNTLLALPGVTHVQIDAALKTATATVDPQKFNATTAVSALRQVRFPANKVDGPVGEKQSAK
jgi:copper chaperone CopZ